MSKGLHYQYSFTLIFIINFHMALIKAFMGLFNYVLRLFLMNCIQKQAIFPPKALGQALITQTTQFTIRYDTSKVHTIHTHTLVH